MVMQVSSQRVSGFPCLLSLRLRSVYAFFSMVKVCFAGDLHEVPLQWLEWLFRASEIVWSTAIIDLKKEIFQKSS